MSIFDDLNYLQDARNQPAAAATVYIVNEDGSESEVDLPMKWGVCSVCEGEGKHVNPSIDAGGLSSEDFCDDYEFGQDYMDGVYDVTCYRCKGRTTEAVVDYDAMSPELAEAYRAQQQAEAECRAEELAELRAGC